MSHPILTKKKNRVNKLPGFTLVELIVVITILAILGTIGFISIQGYSSSARDSARISNLVNLQKGLALFNVTSGSYPMPESPIAITASGTMIGYQGFAKDQIAGIAKLSAGATKDPLDPSIYTTYSVNSIQTRMQIMAFLEDGNKAVGMENILGVSDTFAGSNTNYVTRSPYTKGDAIGILLGLTGSSLNQPVQELFVAGTFTGIDVANTNTGYTAYVNQKKILTGTWQALKVLTANNPKNSNAYVQSCKDINDSWFSAWDGIYYVNPTGTGAFQMYCDMTKDGGGWGLIVSIDGTNFNHVNASAVTPWNLLALGNGYGKYSDITINSLRPKNFRLEARTDRNARHIWENLSCTFSADQSATIENGCLTVSSGWGNGINRTGIAYKDGSIVNESYVYGYNNNLSDPVGIWAGGSVIYMSWSIQYWTSAYLWEK